MKKITISPQHKPKIEIYKPAQTTHATEYFDNAVTAGFPSPALDSIQKKLDLNEYLIDHPAATFFIRVQGDSMIDANIHTGDILVVDRSLPAKNKDIILAILDGSFTVKRLLKNTDGMYLQPENPEYKPIKITEEMGFEVWGVVTAVIKKFK